MKKLFVFAPAIALVALLLNSFGPKEKVAGKETAEDAKYFPGVTLCDLLPSPSTGVVPNRTGYGPELPNAVFRSVDGGQTWEEASKGLPASEEQLNLFVGESDLYLNVKNVMYHAKSNLQTPVWEKENVPDLKNNADWPSTSLAFNRSGIMAFGYGGEIYQKMHAAKGWAPVYANFKRNSLRGVFEMSDGTLFFAYDHGLYKSADKGKTWKQVQKGQVINVVESEGVLIATAKNANGIIRSTDHGDTWETVTSEGGVTQSVERITGGFAVISYSRATNSRRVRISLDRGETWQYIDGGLPPSLNISSIRQLGNYLVCGHPDGIFRSSDMGKTWNRILQGDGKKVFRVYVSGNILYAVSGSPGC